MAAAPEIRARRVVAALLIPLEHPLVQAQPPTRVLMTMLTSRTTKMKTLSVQVQLRELF